MIQNENRLNKRSRESMAVYSLSPLPMRFIGVKVYGDVPSFNDYRTVLSVIHYRTFGRVDFYKCDDLHGWNDFRISLKTTVIPLPWSLQFRPSRGVFFYYDTISKNSTLTIKVSKPVALLLIRRHTVVYCFKNHGSNRVGAPWCSTHR